MKYFNEKSFFDSVRSSLFNGRLSQGVVDTIQSITNEYFQHGTDLRELAYILATAYHESFHRNLNPEWEPVREGFAKTNQGAINAVTSLYKRGVISKNYALPDPVTGHSYYGRSWVQTTHKYNYKKMGDRIGVDLVNNPDLALKRDVSAKLLVVGSLEGLYTGKKLSDYITPTKTDYINARRVINAKDKAELIAGYAQKFYDALTKG